MTAKRTLQPAHTGPMVNAAVFGNQPAGWRRRQVTGDRDLRNE
jgi:hypothetical protein